MSDHKAGQRVRYVGPMKALYGSIVTIRCVHEDGSADLEGMPGLCVQPTSLQPLTPEAPAAITIDRTDLPEVDSNNDGLLWIGSKSFSSKSLPAERRRIALEQLAIVEFLEARERQAAEDEEAERVGKALHEAKVNDLAKTISVGLGMPGLFGADCVKAAEALLVAGWEKVGG